MIKIGYGISDYASMVNENFYYVDRTEYIEKLEKLATHYVFYLRPRRFGKSLFISTLSYYYSIKYKDDFQTLFGKYYIGNNPTDLANSFLVLTFDFSGIDTSSFESTYQGFLRKVSHGIEYFFNKYEHLFDKNVKESILNNQTPEGMISDLFAKVAYINHKIYLLIDEYDHFANELISFNLSLFQNIVTKNGFVRKFYENIKTATRDSVVGRLFVTGISPITLDSLTSGFNIATQFTMDLDFHNLMGFTEGEVTAILKGIDVKEEELPTLIKDMKKWYDGYLFNAKAKILIYNPDMVLYFVHFYQRLREYPEKMLDYNIVSDYSKIRKLFRIGGLENEKIFILEKIIKGEKTTFDLTGQFSFEKRGFPTEDLLSLLFYMGYLTIKRKWGDRYEMVIPNKVIRDIYFEYFLQVIEEKAQTNRDLYTLGNALDELIWENNPKPILEIFEETLKSLSNRDYQKMDEKHIQTMFYAYLNLSKMYEVKSEYESQKQYFDILMLETPLAEAKYEFIFEFKYLEKAGDIRLETVKTEATEQINRYLKTQELSKHAKLKAWVFIIVKDTVKVCEEIFL